MLHPHVHCLVTGGGVTPDGHWKAVRHGFLLPARVVMAVFRGKMLDAIRRAWTRGELVVPEGLRPSRRCSTCSTVSAIHGRRAGIVRIMERYAHGVGVVTYSGSLPAGRSHQERAPRGLGWRACHLHLSRSS